MVLPNLLCNYKFLIIGYDTSDFLTEIQTEFSQLTWNRNRFHLSQLEHEVYYTYLAKSLARRTRYLMWWRFFSYLLFVCPHITGITVFLHVTTTVRQEVTAQRSLGTFMLLFHKVFHDLEQILVSTVSLHLVYFHDGSARTISRAI